tara:strand:+ start:493 stop:741 length:249 start_codon:yes stop_codon:yes gene_type:complete
VRIKNMDNKKEKNSAQNWADGFIKYGLDNGYIKPPKKEKNPAHCWKTYIEQAKKTGLESPTPYKVIPYKNGIGIKKIEFIKK